MRKAVFSVISAAFILAAHHPSEAQGRQAVPGDTAKAAAPSAPPAAADTAAKAAAAPAAPPTAAPAAPPVAVDSAHRITGQAPAPDTARAATADSAAPAADTAAPAAKPRKRKRVVRETTVNTIDELKGRYRSPKKALFMSLVVPGLGQAYVGQHWSNYARGAAYFLTDVGLALGWRHYVGTKQDRQIRRYRAFADSNWRMSKYEDTIAIQASGDFDPETFSDLNDHRAIYCQAVQEKGSTAGNQLHAACAEPGANETQYNRFRDTYRDDQWPGDSVPKFRATMPNPQSFYELIGKEVEFVTGWKDAEGIRWDTTYYRLEDGDRVAATSGMQQEYIRMRSRANDYARMQAWFLGGIVVNHIVSAFDAALAAHLHNKRLYQTDLGLLDRLRLDSHIAWVGELPAPTVTATFTF